MTKLRLTIHPIYFGVMLYYIIIGRGVMFLSYLLAVLLHELAHSYSASRQGYALGKITLMPYGALLGGSCDMPNKAMAKVSLAGPLANIFLALLTISLWWLFPSTYTYTRYFLYANIIIAVFNMLPAYPLDGSRIILSIPVKNKLKLVKMLRLCGVICGIAFIMIGIISIWYQFNISLVFTGAFILLSAVLGGGDEVYSHIASRPLMHKNYQDGVMVQEIIISQESKLYKILRHIKSDRIIIFKIIDNTGNIVAVLNEVDISEILIKNPSSMKIKNIIK